MGEEKKIQQAHFYAHILPTQDFIKAKILSGSISASKS